MIPLRALACVLAGSLAITSSRDAEPVARLALPQVGRVPLSVSSDGRYVAFESEALLTPEDTNGTVDIYVLDRIANRLTLETRAADGGPTNGTSTSPRLSGDGRWLVFESTARNLVADVADRTVDLYVRDRSAGTTRRLIPSTAIQAVDRFDYDLAISADGRLVARSAPASHHPAAARDPFDGAVLVIDREHGEVARVDLTSAGVAPSAGSGSNPSLSADGRFVAFTSSADLAGDGTRLPRGQVYVRDRTRGTTVLASATPEGRPGNGASGSASISADGRLVAFVSDASDLTSGDDNHLPDVYVRDLDRGVTMLVSHTARGRSGRGASLDPAISADGRIVAFASDASDLGCVRRCAAEAQDNNLLSDVYLADLAAGSIQRLSGDAQHTWWRPSVAPAMDAHGEVVAFLSKEPISPADLADDFDLFLWRKPGR